MQGESSSGATPAALASNPAMALAFSAAFAALTSPSALASIGMQPPTAPLQPPPLTQVGRLCCPHLMMYCFLILCWLADVHGLSLKPWGFIETVTSVNGFGP